MNHLAKKSECRSTYTEEEIQDAKTLRLSRKNKSYHELNKSKRRIYNIQNKEKIKKQKQTWNIKNQKQIAQKQAVYNKKNQSTIAQKQAVYNKKNQNKITQKQAVYNKKNKSTIAQKQAVYDKKDQRKIAQKQAVYNKKNQRKIAQKQAVYNKKNREIIAKRQAVYNEKNQEIIEQKQAVYNKKNQKEIAEKQSEYNDLYVNKRPRYPRDWDWSKIAGHMLLSDTPKYKQFCGKGTRREEMWMDQEQLADYIQHYKKKGHPFYQSAFIDYSFMLTSEDIKPENQPKYDQLSSVYKKNPLNCEIGLSNTVIFPGDGIFKGEAITEVINVITKLKTKPDQPEAEHDDVINWWINPEQLILAVTRWKYSGHLCLRGIRFTEISNSGNDWESKCTWTEKEKKENEEKVVKSWKDLSDKPQELLEKYKINVQESESSSEKLEEEEVETNAESDESFGEEPKFLIWVLNDQPNCCYCDEYMCSTCFCTKRGMSVEELEEIIEHVHEKTGSGDSLLRILDEDEPKILVLGDDPDCCYCDKYMCSHCFCENTGMSKEKLLERTEKLNEVTEHGEILLKLLKKASTQSRDQV